MAALETWDPWETCSATVLLPTAAAGSASSYMKHVYDTWDRTGDVGLRYDKHDRRLQYVFNACVRSSGHVSNACMRSGHVSNACVRSGHVSNACVRSGTSGFFGAVCSKVRVALSVGASGASRLFAHFDFARFDFARACALFAGFSFFFCL